MRKAIIATTLLINTYANAGELINPLSHTTKNIQQEDAYICPTAPPAIYNVDGVKKYTDKKNSLLSKDLDKKNKSLMKPLDDFIQATQSQTSAYIADPDKNQHASTCALNTLYNWANQKALTGSISPIGAINLRWRITGISLSYLAIKNTNLDKKKQHATIQEWFKTLGHISTSSAELQKPKNNLLYWAAAAAVTTGIASNDRNLYEWGVSQTIEALSEVQSNGTLPRELERGVRAMAYHNFALTPLVIIAELTTANGHNLYEVKNGAIKRLANFVINNMGNCDEINALTSTAQLCGQANSHNIAWAEPYFLRFKDPRIKPWLEKLRPIEDPYAGGNTTLLFSPIKNQPAAQR